MRKKRVTTVTLLNGRLVDDRQAQISVFDNALLYAEGLFETCLGIDDRVIFLKEHLDRLYRGARLTGLRIPIDRQRLARWLKRAARLHPAPVKKIRLTVTSGESARWVGVSGKPQVLISVAPHQIQRRPFHLCVSEFRIDQDSIFRQIKTISYAIHAAAFKQARQRGCDDAILLNGKGRVAEATSANIFWVRRGRIYTPSLDDGCLDGVSRRKIITLAKRLDIPIVERAETLSRLVQADEIFISSSLKLVAATGKIIIGRRHYQIRTGPLTAEISLRFNRLIQLPDNLC